MLGEQRDHLDKAAAAREYMKDCQKRAKDAMGDAVMGEHEPLSGPDTAHYGFDFAQGVSIKWPHKHKKTSRSIFGVN